MPPQQPRLTRADVAALFSKHLTPDQRRAVEAFLKEGVLVVGLRGYYRDSQGVVGVNDRGIYDDAILIVSDRLCLPFNANTDPSRRRDGQGTGGVKGMATLKPGLWMVHHFGKHKGQYEALIQTAAKVTVARDSAAGPYEDTGWFGINIHRGGVTTTSSEGCQTLPPSQYATFMERLQGEAQRLYGQGWKSRVVPYVLMDVA